ncbi:MAG: tetratricopeptide repeat protein [Spirochaetaceae bacterium]|nr:tetratricopeptide repeat protein [Spirochaetaceae bacterium]
MSTNFDSQLNRAKDAYFSHDYELAVKLLEECLQEEPDDISILSEMGKVYVGSGNDEEALKYYSRVLELDDKNFTAIDNIGSIYRRLGRYQDSVDILNKAFEIDKDSIATYYNLGQTYKVMERYDDAIKCFEHVLEKNPNDVLAHNHLGCIYALQNNHEKALELFNKALRIDANHPIIHYNSATSYEALGKYEEAEEAYENALRKKPGWIEAMMSLARLHHVCGHDDQAEEILRQAINLAYNNPEVHTALGNLLLHKERYEEAGNEFDKALSLNKEFVDALSGKISSLEKLGRKDDAYDLLLQMEQIGPDDVNLTLQCAHFLMNIGKYNESSKRIRKILDIDPNNADALALLGEYLLINGEDTKALHCFEKAVKLKPENIKYRFEAARHLFDLGNFEAAELEMRYYLASMPEDCEAWIYLGIIYSELAEIENAVKVFKKAQSLDKDNPALMSAVTRLHKQYPENELVTQLFESILNDASGSNSDLDNLGEAIAAYENSTGDYAENEDVEKNLQLLDSEDDLMPLSDLVEDENQQIDEKPIDALETEEVEEDVDPEEFPDELFLGGGDGLDALRKDESENEPSPIDFDVSDEDFNSNEDDFDSLVLGSGDDVPIDSDPAAEEDSYDPFSSGNGGKKPNDVMESEEVLELGDGKPNQQPPYTPPPPPYYPPQPIYYPPQEQKLPPLPPLPNFEKRKLDPREDNLALDAALNQAIDSKLMNLAENSEEVETPGARKRRELRAAIREALKKLRDSSIERRSPEHVSIADMFAYMRGLCNYLPQPKKSLFLSSEERVKLEYVINRLKSSPGLFNETTEVSRVIEEKEDKDDSKEPSDADAPAEETETEAEDTKPSKEEISGTILCLQNMIEDNMDDKDLVSALNAKVRRVLARCDTEKLQL